MFKNGVIQPLQSSVFYYLYVSLLGTYPLAEIVNNILGYKTKFIIKIHFDRFSVCLANICFTVVHSDLEA